MPEATDIASILDGSISGSLVIFSILTSVLFIIWSLSTFLSYCKKSGAVISFLALAQVGSLPIIIITAYNTPSTPAGGLLYALTSANYCLSNCSSPVSAALNAGSAFSRSFYASSANVSTSAFSFSTYAERVSTSTYFSLASLDSLSILIINSSQSLDFLANSI